MLRWFRILVAGLVCLSVPTVAVGAVMKAGLCTLGHATTARPHAAHIIHGTEVIAAQDEHAGHPISPQPSGHDGCECGCQGKLAHCGTVPTGAPDGAAQQSHHDNRDDAWHAFAGPLHLAPKHSLDLLRPPDPF